METRAELTEDEDLERIALSWLPTCANPSQAWEWAAEAARTRRPINWAMNTQLNAAKRATPLETRLEELGDKVPARTVFIGGSEDTRPKAELERLAEQLGVSVVMIADAGHEPWVEQPDRFREALRTAIASQDSDN